MILSAASAEAAVPRWKKKLQRATNSRHVSVRVTRGHKVLVDKRSSWMRIPASNQKLLLSMALLGKLGPRARFRTTALAEPKAAPLADAGRPNIKDGVLRSHLWIAGRGDPTLSSTRGGYGGWLAVEPTWVGDLAREIKQAGIKRIAGRIVGVRSYFKHDWYAPGWKEDFPRRYVALPSALALNGNQQEGRHVSDPEWHLARALTQKLEEMKIWVRGNPRSGDRPGRAVHLAHVDSRPLKALLRHMNRHSSNFFAEVLGKALAVDAGHRPGTIRMGARTLRTWVAARGVEIRAHDGSGLSYANRVSARGIVRLLQRAERAGWGDELFGSLPKAGWGTLQNRLSGVRLRAKTGTLDHVSSLSGWLWLRKSERWARFSILINGLPSWEAKEREDSIVRLVARNF